MKKPTHTISEANTYFVEVISIMIFLALMNISTQYFYLKLPSRLQVVYNMFIININ